jgi:hypothetical protein
MPAEKPRKQVVAAARRHPAPPWRPRRRTGVTVPQHPWAELDRFYLQLIADFWGRILVRSVVFLRADAGKIVFLREYFDPVRAANAMDLTIAGLES